MLYLYRRIVFGELTKDDVKAMPDIKPREWAIFVPLAAVALWMGIYPESFLAPMRGAVTPVVARPAPATTSGAAPLAARQPHHPNARPGASPSRNDAVVGNTEVVRCSL